MRPRPAHRSTVTGLSLSLIFLAAGCHDQSARPGEQSPTASAITVSVIEVTAKAREATEEVVGTVQSKIRATVEAKVTGRILRLPVTLGQAVKAGELIAELDAQEIRSRYDQAVATRDQAARDIERARRLLAEKVVSQSEFDDIQARFSVAAAGVTEAETMAGYTRLTAPFDGVVTRKHVEVGDFASPGKPLVDLEDPSQMRIEANVPETAINRLTLGAKLPVRLAGHSTPLAATISEIAPSADPGSRTFLIRADLPPTGTLRSGQFGRTEVPIGETSALRVPAAALSVRGQLEFLIVAKDGTAHLRLVKTGKQIGEEIEIVSGLEAGESIVRRATREILDGQPLNIQP